MADNLLLTAGRWLSGDAFRARTRRALLVVVFTSAAAMGYGLVQLRDTVAPLVHAPPPPQVPADHGDSRFGIPIDVRRAIFDEFAAAEPTSRAEGKRAFSGPALEWSAEDHRGSFERQKAASLAVKYRVSLTQVYLCLDEGIHERWPGPDGEPLTPFTVPLNPRRKYGF